MLKLIIEKMLLIKAGNIFHIIFLMNLMLLSFSLNLKKQFEDGKFDYSKEISHLSNNNTFSDIKNIENYENKYNIHFEIEKHHVKEEHLFGPDTFLNKNKSLENFDRKFQILKVPSDLKYLVNKNSSVHDLNKVDLSDETEKNEYLLLNDYSNQANKNKKTKDVKINIIMQQSNFSVKNYQNNETNIKYDFVYYPKVIESKLNLPLRRDGVFNCKDCKDYEDTKNSINMKVPDEDKWIKLESVKFVKAISEASKADLEIENIEE